MDLIPSVREEPGGRCSCGRNPSGAGRWAASADRAQRLCWLHLCHRYVMTHLSALSRPHGWMAVRKSRVSLSPGHLAGRCSHIPICPCSRAAPHPCTLTQPHSSGSMALGQDWWEPSCPTTSPDHKVTTSTPNRQSQIVAKIYTFLKNKKLLF